MLDAAIRDVLVSGPEIPIDYYAEYLEADRFGQQASAALAEYIRRKYQRRRIDLVIAMTNDSLQFVLDHRDELFPDVPIVFAGIAVPDESVRRAGAGIAVIRVGSAYVETLKLALELHPSTERVFVVARSTNRQDVDSVRAQLSDFSRQVQLTYIEEETLPRLLEVIKAVPPRSIILHIWQRGFERKDTPDPVEVARLVAEAAPVPVYGTIDLNIGTGIVGGVVRGTRETGVRVGEMALQILERHDDRRTFRSRTRRSCRSSIGASSSGGASIRRGCRHGSNIRFFTPTVWEAYRPYIIAIAIVVAAQLLAIAGLLVQRARRRRAEETVLAREATIRDELRTDSAARGTTDQRTGGRARGHRPRSPRRRLPGTGGRVDRRRQPQRARPARFRTRTRSRRCRGSTARRWACSKGFGVSRTTCTRQPCDWSAWRRHCARTASKSRSGMRCDVRFTTDGDFAGLDPDVALCFFRIAQESLRNGVVHGEARRLSVSLARSGD